MTIFRGSIAIAVMSLVFAGRVASAQTCPVGTPSSLGFDGGDEVRIAYDSVLSGFSDFTFEIWGRSSGIGPGGFASLISKWDYPSLTDYSFIIDSGSVMLHSGLIGGSARVVIAAPAPAATDGDWHHFAVSRTGTTVTLFLDGVVIQSSQFSDLIGFASIQAPTRIGETSANGMPNLGWNGLLDEVRIWNCGRTPAQIQASMSTILFGEQPGLVGYWRLDDGGSSSTIQIVDDLSITGANGVRGSGPAVGMNDPTWSTADVAPLVYPGNGRLMGQCNGPGARLEVNGVGSGTTPGPFFVQATPGGTLFLSWLGDPGQPFILLSGPLNVGNDDNPFIGSVDIGTPCLNSPYMDVVVLFDGTQPPGSALFTTNGNGFAGQSFSLPLCCPPGPLITLQGVMMTSSGFPFRLTAAFQIVL